MRFEETWRMAERPGRLAQEEAAQFLGVCERTFRRHNDQYEDEGVDNRLNQLSRRRTLVDEVMKLVDRCRSRHEGWSAKHPSTRLRTSFYAWYCQDGGERCYTWVKNRLQVTKLVPHKKLIGTLGYNPRP